MILHLQAGREAARRLGGPEGVIAPDVIGALPAALARNGSTDMRRVSAPVNLAAIERNCSRLRRYWKRPQLCAVVKADGYGHGAVQSATAALAAGASWLAVAGAGEALELRAAHIQAPILIMGALTEVELEEALRLTPTSSSGTSLPSASGGAGGGRVHIKLDTGMGRLGTRDPQLAGALADAAASTQTVKLAGVMTHFATADEPHDDFFDAQLEGFSSGPARSSASTPTSLIHAANSAASSGSHERTST